MVHYLIHTPFSKALAIVIFALQIVACGGGGGSDSTFTTASSSGTVSEQTVPTEPINSPVEEETAPVESVSDPVVEETASVTSNGSMTMSWTAPVTRADGSPMSLADIDGYRIYYGDSAGSYPDSVDVTDGTAVTATVNNIPSGTYHIVMSTYDVDGRESAFSSEVTKTTQ